MTVNFSSVVKIVSFLFVVLGFSMIPALLVALIYNEEQSIISFIVIIVHCICVGAGFGRIYQLTDLKKIKTRDGFLIVALCWMISSAVGALPFVMSNAIPSYVDAFFESCSGFSTTGSTILTDVESLPKSILFWRSFTHWLGGMGIIIFATALLPSIGIKGKMLASAESSGPVRDKVSSRFSDSSRNLCLLYFLFTIAETILLLFGGMNVYDALIHSFGTIGTGGFSSYNDGIAHFDSSYIHWIILLFMLISGINFNLYFLLLKKGIKTVFKDAELKMYLGVIGIVSTLILINTTLTIGGRSLGQAFTDSVFQVVSIVSTTGYTTCDYELWPTFSKMLIFLLMLVGACSASAGGGVKMIRILVALKMIRRGVFLKLHPNLFVPVSIGNRAVTQEVATNIANYIFLYIAVIFGGSLVISLNGFDLMTTISSVIACVGNVGPGFGLAGPSLDFSMFSNGSKFILSLLMIAGRLELFTFFLLFSPHYWNANKV